jgi:hypothetical protein
MMLNIVRFEPLLQNTINNGGTWAEFNLLYQKGYDKKKIKNTLFIIKIIYHYVQEKCTSFKNKKIEIN